MTLWGTTKGYADSQELLFDTGTKAIGPIYDRATMIATAVAEWRARGFPYRSLSIVECMDQINRLAVADDETLAKTDAAYHVADTYHRHRFESSAVNMKSPLTAFGDDVLLERTIRLLLENDQPITATSLLGKLAIVSGTQACANFRPGFAVAMLRRFGQPDGKVLDTSSGYGGRLVGWIASGLGGEYIGVDPSGASCAANLRMAADLGYGERVTQLWSPAEDIDPDGLLASIGQVDFCFTSPPYFTKERYATGHPDEANQTWRRYPTDDAWRTGFLQPMIDLQYRMLRPGRYSVINVADVKINSKVYPLTDWTLEAAAAVGFAVEEELSLKLTRRYGRSQASELASEPAWVLRKPEAGVA